MSWVKVPISQDDHKTLHNLPRGFDTYLVDIKTMSKIAQVFVTFWEKLNFIRIIPTKIGRFSDYLIKCSIKKALKIKV